MSEEVTVDFSKIPLKPVGKSEITQLEMALIVGTLYRPEILELIRDPVERSTWMDSLAVAAAAFARHKAGIPVSKIAEELGRSEASIRNHLSEKTKAGKLIAETYEKLRKNELRLGIPFIKAPVQKEDEERKILQSEIERLRSENNTLRRELEETRTLLEKKLGELEALKKQVNELKGLNEELSTKLNKAYSALKQIKEIVSAFTAE